MSGARARPGASPDRRGMGCVIDWAPKWVQVGNRRVDYAAGWRQLPSQSEKTRDRAAARYPETPDGAEGGGAQDSDIE